jgi:hypothetical protein
MEEIVDAMLLVCPDPAAMASELNTNLGLATSDSQTDDETGKTKSTGAETVPGCVFQFKDLLTEDNNVFTVKGIGVVGETRITLRVVMDAKGSDPSQWSYLYFRMD